MTTETLEFVEDIFNLKDPLIISNNIEKKDYLEVSPTTSSATQLNDGTISFEINNTANYLTLFDSYLRITLKLTDATDATNVKIFVDTLAPEFNWVAGLFKTASLKLGGKEVESLANVYAISTLKGLCLRSEAESNTYGEIEGWIPDIVEADGTVNTIAANTGWKKRKALYQVKNATTPANAELFEVCISLRSLGFGFCDVHRILYLMPIGLDLVRNTNYSQIFSGTAGSGNVIIDKITWMIPSITPSNERKTAITKLLTENDYIPITFLRTFEYEQDLTDNSSFVIKTTSNNPRYFIMGIKNTNTATFATTYNKFDNGAVTEIQIDLNGILYPVKPMKLDFVKRQISAGYVAYKKFCLKNGVEPPLSLIEFRDIYTLYVIDTSALPITLKSNAILVKVTISKTGAGRFFCVVLEDELNKKIKVGNGTMQEYI